MISHWSSNLFLALSCLAFSATCGCSPVHDSEFVLCAPIPEDSVDDELRSMYSPNEGEVRSLVYGVWTGEFPGSAVVPPGEIRVEIGPLMNESGAPDAAVYVGLEMPANTPRGDPRVAGCRGLYIHVHFDMTSSSEELNAFFDERESRCCDTAPVLDQGSQCDRRRCGRELLLGYAGIASDCVGFEGIGNKEEESDADNIRLSAKFCLDHKFYLSAEAGYPDNYKYVGVKVSEPLGQQ